VSFVSDVLFEILNILTQEMVPVLPVTPNYDSSSVNFLIHVSVSQNTQGGLHQERCDTMNGDSRGREVAVD